ncbi:hypothetical protein C8R43DRAFT_1138891 [Mycena crocata]|nr:hypothetical protein C8R43DRAFT_1138891 [Mycena crocata]
MIHLCGILGASDPLVDDWMATEIAVATALVASSSTKTQIYTVVPFRSFACCKDGHFKFGDPKADRLGVPVPDDSLVIVNRNGATLKQAFLQKIANITICMHPHDRLIVLIAAHGEEEGGEVLLGEHTLKISEVSAAVKNNAKTVLWSTTCFSGKWIEGTVAAAAKEQSESPLASVSNYTRGGTSMLTTSASLAPDQDIMLPSSLPASSNPTHCCQHATPIRDAPHRSLSADHAEGANDRRKDSSGAYDADTVADPSTQLPLPVPQLTSEVLDRFQLIRHNPSISPTAPTTTKVGSLRRQIEQLLPISGFDLEEFLQSGGKLVEAEISSAHLVYLSRCLQKPNLTQEDASVLLSAFQHRRQCQLAVEMYLDCVGWRSTRPPKWDSSGGGAELEREMVEGDKAAAPWRAFFSWKPAVAGWRTLSWTDIRQQLALAWEGAGRPPFSATKFLAIANSMDNVKKMNILASASAVSLQGVVHLIARLQHCSAMSPSPSKDGANSPASGGLL